MEKRPDEILTLKIILESAVPLVVEFFTERHGACHIIGPAMNEMSEKFGDRVRFLKINADRDEETARKYGVQEIPSVLFFKKGRIVDRLNGVFPRAVIAEKIRALAKPGKAEGG